MNAARKATLTAALRERAYLRHGTALVQHWQAKARALLHRTVDNLTALHIAAFNLEQAEQELADWNADE